MVPEDAPASYPPSVWAPLSGKAKVRATSPSSPLRTALHPGLETTQRGLEGSPGSELGVPCGLAGGCVLDEESSLPSQGCRRPKPEGVGPRVETMLMTPGACVAGGAAGPIGSTRQPEEEDPLERPWARTSPIDWAPTL